MGNIEKEVNTDKLIAFGIDGTVTKKDNRKHFNELAHRDRHKVGLITTQPEPFASILVEEFNIEPDFIESGYFRIYALCVYRASYSETDLTYVGCTFLENLVAGISGWDYVDVESIEDELI